MLLLPSEATLYLLFALVQAWGLVSLLLTRLAGSPLRNACMRGSFVCALVAVGAVTMLALFCHNGAWIFSSGTLAVMAVGGTLDLGNCRLQISDCRL